MVRNVAILLFDEVEVLDFAGPFEIFSVAGRREEGAPPFNGVSKRQDRVSGTQRLRISSARMSSRARRLC